MVMPWYSQAQTAFSLKTPNQKKASSAINKKTFVLLRRCGGAGELATLGKAKSQEQAIASTHPEVVDFLSQCGFEQERRAIKIWPSQLEWHSKGDTLTLSFSLPSGCFATSVLRECIETVAPVHSI